MILGITSFILWMLAFAAGVLIDSEPYRTKLRQGTDIWQNFLPSVLLYTPINAAILSAFAGLIGGCASNLVYQQDECSKLLEARDRDNSVESTKLVRRLSYMSESPFLSLLRGFVVYLTFLGGILIASDDPFKSGSGVQFMRYAGIVSLVAFGMGYDPTRFEQLLENIPTIGAKPKPKS